jgi:putative PIN family toxin of toxin-antitoxin system
MRLVVLDTNVVVSAGIKRESVPARLVMEWILEGQVQVVVCPVIVAEYRDVLGRQKFRRHGFPPQWLEFLIEESLHLPDPDPWTHAIPDPNDGPFLALAQVSGAWLVSGNQRHFPEGARGGVTVLAPAEYLAHLVGHPVDDSPGPSPS